MDDKQIDRLIPVVRSLLPLIVWALVVVAAIGTYEPLREAMTMVENAGELAAVMTWAVIILFLLQVMPKR